MKCRIPPRPLTEKQQKKADKYLIQQNSRVLNYVGRLIAVYLHENAGFGHTRFSRYNDRSYELGRAYIDRFTTAEEEAEEYAVTSYYAIRHDLRYIGWFAEFELWQDDVFDTLAPPSTGMTRSQRQQRAALIGYAKGISFYAREMMCIAAKELNESNGFGCVRINKVLHPVRDRYLKLMKMYIAQENEALKAELQNALDEFNALGFFKEEKL